MAMPVTSPDELRIVPPLNSSGIAPFYLQDAATNAYNG
jgi:hypothetical protein